MPILLAAVLGARPGAGERACRQKFVESFVFDDRRRFEPRTLD